MDLVLATLKDAGDYRFWPLPSQVDEQVMNLIGDLMRAADDERKTFLSGLAERGGYALLAFAERMSMLGVRRSSADTLRLGLVALVLAMHRIDPRMGLMILSLLYRSAEKLDLPRILSSGRRRRLRSTPPCLSWSWVSWLGIPSTRTSRRWGSRKSTAPAA